MPAFEHFALSALLGSAADPAVSWWTVPAWRGLRIVPRLPVRRDGLGGVVVSRAAVAERLIDDVERAPGCTLEILDWTCNLEEVPLREDRVVSHLSPAEVKLLSYRLEHLWSFRCLVWPAHAFCFTLECGYRFRIEMGEQGEGFYECPDAIWMDRTHLWFDQNGRKALPPEWGLMDWWYAYLTAKGVTCADAIGRRAEIHGQVRGRTGGSPREFRMVTEFGVDGVWRIWSEGREDRWIGDTPSDGAQRFSLDEVIGVGTLAWTNGEGQGDLRSEI